MRKCLCLVLVWAVLLCALSGCSAKEAYRSYAIAELSIQLPESFVDLGGSESFSDYDFIFSDGTVTVSGIREDRAQLREYGADPSLDQYIRLLIGAHGLDCQPLQTDGIHFFNYEAGSSQLFTYVVTVWETEDAFWTVQAYCPSERYSQVRDAIWQYLSSVTF